MLNQIKALADELFPEVVRLRRHLHRRPELSFQEHETARFVQAALEPLDVEVQPGVAGTGLVVTFKGDRPGPTVSLRADMDALPILEENTFDFVSEKPGVMHACGHDAHTASLLGAAMMMHRLRAEWPGTVRMLFQPGEEKIPGGAKTMIAEGALDASAVSGKSTAVFGQHVAPDQRVGTIAVRKGFFMTSCDELFLTVEGQGGHAAMPHRLQADPVLVAAHIVVALQSVISRNRPPDVTSVLSFGRLVADGATNVIPERARIEGGLRALDETWRFRAHELIERVAKHTAQAFGATCEVDIHVGYPSLYNDPALAALVRDCAVAYVGEANTLDADLWMASEDFAYFAQHVPGTFYRLGVGNEAAGIVHGLHTPRFTIDEEALRTGPGFMTYLAWRYAQKESSKLSMVNGQ